MSDKLHDVIVIGELNIDLILNKIDSFPEVGKEVIAKEMKQVLGSSSAIFANNLSILGNKVSFLGKVGYDSYAAQIGASFKLSGVDVSNIQKSSTHLTGLTVAFNYDNDRAMITYPGAMADLTINDISDDVFMSASHMHLSSIFLQDGLKPDIVELFRRAKRHRLTTSLDPQWDPKEKWDIDLKALLPYVDVFLPNETEIRKLTGALTIDEAINKIKPYCNIVVVKNGTKGAVMWDKANITTKAPYLNNNVVDAIGAGDSFNAGFISKFIKKQKPDDCLDFGTLMGAVNTTAAGGTGAFKNIDIVRQTALTRFNKSF